MSMFSFMSRSTKDVNVEKTSPAPGGGLTPSTINSSLEDNSLFGGMEVSSVDNNESTEEPVVSGFSFMSSQPEEPTAEVSSFSFLNSSTVESTEIQLQSHLHSEPEPTVDLMSSPVKVVEPPNLKMSKASAPKVVKKKKRVSRVGLGRDDDDDEPEAAVTQSTHSTPLPSVKEAGHDHDDNTPSDVEVERRHSMQKSESNSAFDFLVESTAPQHLSVVPEIEEPAVNRPALLSFSVPDQPVTSLSLTDFDGLSIHSETTALAAPVAVVPTIKSTDVSTAITSVEVSIKNVENLVVQAAVSGKEATTQDKSVVSINTFHDAVVSMTKILNSCVDESKRIRFLVTSESNSLTSMKSQLTALENEQAKHAQEEDFDQADAMTAPIEQVKVNIEKKSLLIDSLKSEAINIDETFADRKRKLLLLCQETLNSLSVTKDQLIVEADELQSSEISGNEIEEMRIRVEEERISLEKSHFEKEELALAEELKTTEDAIKSQSGTIQSKKEDLEINLLSVQSEIKILEAQLAAKKADESQLLKELNLVDSKISEVRKKYERQLQRIQDRSYALSETKRECLAEEAALLEEKNSYAKKAQDLLDARVSFIDWTKAVKDDLAVMNFFVQNTTADVSLLGCASAINSGNAETASLQAAQQEALSALNNAACVESNMRKEIEDLSVEGRLIVDQIPKLEAEKKSHATSKRFKEAASVAKDIKDQQTRKEEIDTKIDELTAQLAIHCQGVEHLQDHYKSVTKALTDVQKEQDIVRCKALLERANILRSIINKVNTAKSSEYKLAPALSGAVADIPADVVFFFASELLVVTEEAQIIKDTHQLPDSMFVDNDTAVLEETVKVEEETILHSHYESVELIPEQGVNELTMESLIEGEPLKEDDIVTTQECTIEDAEELKNKISLLTEEMNIASEIEDYEKAAELDEQIGSHNETLEKMLSTLGMTEDAL